MTTVSIKYVELAKKKSGLSYYAIAKEIGVTPQTINNLKIRPGELNDSALLRLAKIAQIAPNKIVAEVHMKKAKSQVEKDFWGMVAHSSDLAKQSASYILC
ncbi:MAG: hypothetical protein ISEC1_P1949 [Thiomicrorhabdus sp.]|nr:MAG: hypothetical protein ISEC1_P1949 [Thiomicrorhabdus sp.]